MRTTVTFDPDTERFVRTVMREHGLSFKQALNDAIRAGITPGKQRGRARFVQKSFPLGAEQSCRWDKALTVGEAMEDEELGRKLAQ